MNELSRRSVLASFSALLAVRTAFAEGLQGVQALAPDAYLLDDGVTYLNHASVGTIPRLVHDAHVGYLAACERNPWLHVWGDAWGEGIERAHEGAAAILGANLQSVALVRNATAAFGMAANGLPLGEGDEVLFSSLNHVGASASWQDAAAARGFATRRFAFPVGEVRGMTVDDVTEAYVSQVTDATRALVLPHVDNVFGLRHDVKTIATRARDRGVEWVLVDGAQSVGMHTVDFEDLGVDLYATSAHKWLQAPKATGVMALSKPAIDGMRPLVTSWGRESFGGTARAFTDFGTRDLAKVLTLGDAVDLHRRTNDGREDRLRELRKALFERVGASADLEWRSPRSYDDGGASLVAVGIIKRKAKALARELFEGYGIVVRGFEGDGMNHVRVSPNAMNTVAELDKLMRALES